MDMFEKFLEFLAGIFSPRVVEQPPPPVVVPIIPAAPLPEPPATGFSITNDQLSRIMPKLKMELVGTYVPFLNSALNEFQINTPRRAAAFLAQLAHESLDLSVWQENLNYSAQALVKTWPKRFDEQKAAAYARQPEKIANYVYANRMGNGDESSGDGWKYRGKGPIQLTGKDNHVLYGRELNLDLVSNPDLILQPENGFRVAGRFWQRNGLSELADNEDTREITRRINGGYLGLDHRQSIYENAKVALGA